MIPKKILQNHYISWNKEFIITTKHKLRRHTFDFLTYIAQACILKMSIHLDNHKRLQHVPQDAGYCNQLKSMVEKEKFNQSRILTLQPSNDLSTKQ